MSSEDSTQHTFRTDFYSPPAKPPETPATDAIQLPPPGTKPILSHTCLYKTFSSLINRRHIDLPPHIAEHILTEDLDLPYNKQDAVMQRIIKDCLAYFMLVWPGWKDSTDYFTGKIPFLNWLGKFKTYLVSELSEVIDNQEKYKAEAKQVTESGDKVDKEVETDGDKSTESAIAVEICGPPSLLNSLVFYDTDNDVSIKQLPLKQWVPITFTTLFNWPYTTISVRLPDISFTRSNVHEFIRYLSLDGEISNPPPVNFISSIRPSEENAEHVVYTNEFIREYIEKFSFILSWMYESVDTDPVVKGNVSFLMKMMKELLTDISDVNLYNGTIATKATVCFHIGKLEYIRNKKMVSSNKANPRTINFCEILIPKVEFTIDEFTAEQDTTKPHVLFKSLVDLAQKFTASESPCDFLKEDMITFGCNLCKVYYLGFSGKMHLMEHFQIVHKAEQAVLCFTCRQQFEIDVLAQNRWSHTCKN